MKKLKLFFALFAMLALGVGNASAEEVTFSGDDIRASFNYGNNYKEGTFTSDGFSIYCSSGYGNTAAQFRVAKSATLTINSTVGNITKVVITVTSTSYKLNDNNISWSSTTGTYSNAGGVQEITFTNSNANIARISKIAITYEPSSVGGGDPTPPTTYTIKWHTAVGTTTDVTLNEGTNITKPATDPTMTGYEFMGWTDQCNVATDGAGFTALSDFGTADSDKDFYAVFAVATTSGGGAATDLTIDLSKKNQITTNTTSSLVFTEGDVTFTNTKLSGQTAANNYCPGTSGKTYTSTRTYNGHQVTIAAANTISKIVITAGTNAYATAIENAAWTNATASVNNTTITVTPDADATSVSFKPSATAGMTKVVVTTGGGSISYNNYITTCSGSTLVETLTDAQFAWSAATAEATMGASNTFPTLTNTLPVSVTYESSTPATATIAADGTITLVAPGTTTISAKFAGGEVSGTKYAAKTVTYTLTVKQLVSCADIYTLADDATFVLKDFVVTYVNGDYTYIKDATGYGVIYKNSYGLQAGDQVASGKLEGKKDTYKGLVEIVPTTAAGDLNATSGTAPEPEVMTNTPTNADINKYVKFENVSFKYTNLNDTYKTNSGKLEGQTEYNIAFYNKFTSNVTFDTSKKYDVVGVVSIKDDAIEVYFISAEEVAEPTLNVEITNADFGKIAINGEAERTLTLNGSLLTKPVSLAIEGEGAEHFTLASNSVTPTDGNITDAKIKITYKPIAEGPHTATLKITSDELTAQTITLTGNAVEEYTVHFYLNGEEQTELAKTILSGNTLDALPDATSCDQINYPTFAGWASDAIAGTTGVKPTMLDLSTPITSDCNYYAVFAKGTTSSGSTTSAIMKYTGGTTTNMEDGNNATIVGLDETLFNITSTKTASGTHVGLNKGNDIRLYANKNDGNGNILTISMLDGSSITKITLDIKQEANFVVKADGKSITGADDVYTIGYPSCSIQNTTTGATTQLHLNSITIEYTTSTTTYEYITSCAVVVPTCEITYDYADGEGDCTNAIVEEGAEYTLCATAPTKTGHTFLNWKDQYGTVYAVGATINSVTEDLTLTAQWQVSSYSVTWMSLGDEVVSNSANHNAQPTKPATPAYTCGADKEFVGWTTQEIDGVGVPANLYTDEFPVVTEAITYYAVFAGKSTEATTTTSTLLVTEKLGNYASGSMRDNQENVWNYYAGGFEDAETYYLALRNNSDEKSYIESPKFVGTVQSIVAHVKNGSSSKTRTVYLRSSVVVKPKEGDLGTAAIPASNNSEVALNITSSFDKFYIQVSDGLQFHKIVVTSGVAVGDYIDYTTSCPEPVALGEGDNSEIINAGGTIDVKVNRNFVANTLYTLSLPFAMDNVADIFGVGTILYKYSSLTMVGGELEIGFDKVNSIEAGTPYLIEPAQAVDGFTAEDVTITNTPTSITFTADGKTLTMKPVLTATTGAKTNGEYWLASDRYLYNTQTNLLSLRAVFELNVPEASPVPRARVVFNQNTATGMENVDASAQPVKTIINGQLYILRGEKMYDAQGKLVK